MAQPLLSRRARYMHLGRCHPRRDLSYARAFSQGWDVRTSRLHPGLPICIPYGESRARTGASERHGECLAHRHCGIKEIFRHGARGWEGRHGEADAAWMAGLQQRRAKALAFTKMQSLRSQILFAPAGIFVHVCRRCQRADRAGGFHVGLIFCNFSIKRKVKDYNCLMDWYLRQNTMSLFAEKSRTKRFCFHHHICAIVYIVPYFYQLQ